MAVFSNGLPGRLCGFGVLLVAACSLLYAAPPEITGSADASTAGRRCGDGGQLGGYRFPPRRGIANCLVDATLL